MRVSCFLCNETTPKRTTAAPDWEVNWFRKCCESLAQLLDLEGFTPSYFAHGGVDYCSKCTDLLRDVDYTVRTVTSLQMRASTSRAQIAKFLLARFETTVTEATIEDEKTEMHLLDTMAMGISSPGDPATAISELECDEDGNIELTASSVNTAPPSPITSEEEVCSGIRKNTSGSNLYFIH